MKKHAVFIPRTCEPSRRVGRSIPRLAFGLWLAVSAVAQPYGEADRGQPGDEMIQRFLCEKAEGLHAQFMDGVSSEEDWVQRKGAYRQEYLYMLGLWPLPERTPLQATQTGVVQGEGYTVELLHFQSRPNLYVTANLYRPARIREGERLPAVLYVCGHSPRGRNGNKTAYQSHGIWFARHGYVCLVLDTLQMGEIAAIHHGTYREGRWWWLSRGYTSAGVECWNGIRGIDYLLSRDDVDPDRVAVTGISGGGAATFWIAAADERAAVSVPVSGMADLPSYVCHRVVNGHCDCMFLHNAFQWPWSRIAALIAPRPLLFVNSDQDAIFPMDANRRVINRLERFYSLFGAGDRVDSLVSIGGHAYREDIRRAAYRFVNTWLKNDPSLVHDSEVDLATRTGADYTHPIDPERLRVFESDEDIPEDQLNTAIDRHFVPMAQVPVPASGEFTAWRTDLLDELRRVTFPDLPLPIATAKPEDSEGEGAAWIETEPGIRIPLKRVGASRGADVETAVLRVDWNGAVNAPATERGVAVYSLQPRGIGATQWTEKDPPNYVKRAHVLVGRTVETGQVYDIASAARWIAERHGGRVIVESDGPSSVLAAYAALLEPSIQEVRLQSPVASHMAPEAPSLLNVLRVCDIPEILGMLAPRPLVLSQAPPDVFRRVQAIYAAAGAPSQLTDKEP